MEQEINELSNLDIVDRDLGFEGVRYDQPAVSCLHSASHSTLIYRGEGIMSELRLRERL